LTSGLLAKMAVTMGETEVAARTLEARSASSLQSRFALHRRRHQHHVQRQPTLAPKDDFIAA